MGILIYRRRLKKPKQTLKVPRTNTTQSLYIVSCQRLIKKNQWKFKRYENKCPALGRCTKKCLFMGTQHFTEMTGKCTREGHRYCHNSRYFNVIFRTELSFIRVNISAFQIDFKTLKFKIAENSVQINVYSAVLQFVLPRFISSKKLRSYLTLDGKTKAA